MTKPERISAEDFTGSQAIGKPERFPIEPVKVITILVSVLIFLGSTAMSGRGNHLAALNQPSGLAAAAQQEATLTPTTTPTPPVSDGTNETTGIILAGVILVLIVLGGTIGATRRKS